MSDTNPQAAQLLSLFKSIPAVVSHDKNVRLAEELITSVSKLLGAGPASRPAVHPRPANAGLKWDDLDIDAQIKYDAVVDLLSTDSPHVPLEHDNLEEAIKAVRLGLLRLAELPQQPASGMVQRHS